MLLEQVRADSVSNRPGTSS